MTKDMLDGCIPSSRRKKKSALRKGDTWEYLRQSARESFCEALKGDTGKKKNRRLDEMIYLPR